MAAWRDGFLLRCAMALTLCIFTLGLQTHEEGSNKARSDSGTGFYIYIGYTFFFSRVYARV
jgi:hypothetical protein